MTGVSQEMLLLCPGGGMYMATAVQITLIICITIIALAVIGKKQK